MRLSPASLAAAASQVDKPQTELPQLHHASALRNRVPILKALLKLLPNEELVGDACEIGAGTGALTASLKGSSLSCFIPSATLSFSATISKTLYLTLSPFLYFFKASSGFSSQDKSLICINPSTSEVSLINSPNSVILFILPSISDPSGFSASVL